MLSKMTGVPVVSISPRLGRIDRQVEYSLVAWAQQNDVVITVADALPAGLTEARLYSAYVEGPGVGVRKVVLKVLLAGDDLDGEPGRHRRALNASDRDFARWHLVEQAFAPVALADGGWLLFLNVAGDSLQDAAPLAQLAAEPVERYRLQAICPAVISGVLGNWNSDCVSRVLTVRSFLSKALGSRAPHHVAKLATLLPPERRVELPGEQQALANPLALADGRLRPKRQVRCLIGRRHGDMHAGNIVVPLAVDRDGESFWLIDLSRFDRHGLLALDPCYLAATLAIGWLAELDGYAQSDMIDLLIDPDRAGTRRIPAPMRRALLGIGQAGRDWATAEGRGLGDDWADQVQLAYVACGLLLAGRRAVPDRYRMWCLRLAARAAHQLEIV